MIEGAVERHKATPTWGPPLSQERKEWRVLQGQRVHAQATADLAGRPCYNWPARLRQQGGGLRNPQYRWEHNAIIASTDPVGHDRAGYEFLSQRWQVARGAEGWGHEYGLDPIRRAGELGLGNFDPSMLEILEA